NNNCLIRLAYHNPGEDKGSYSNSMTVGEDEITFQHDRVDEANELTSLVITTPQYVPVGNCQIASLTELDDEGLDFVLPESQTIISSNEIYEDDQCSQPASLVMPAFESSKIFYIKSDSAPNVNLHFQVSNVEVLKDVEFY